MHTNHFEAISSSDLGHVTGGGIGGLVKGTKTAWKAAKPWAERAMKGVDIVNAGQTIWDAGKAVKGWFTGEGGEKK